MRSACFPESQVGGDVKVTLFDWIVDGESAKAGLAYGRVNANLQGPLDSLVAVHGQVEGRDAVRGGPRSERSRRRAAGRLDSAAESGHAAARDRPLLPAGRRAGARAAPGSTCGWGWHVTRKRLLALVAAVLLLVAAIDFRQRIYVPREYKARGEGSMVPAAVPVPRPAAQIQKDLVRVVAAAAAGCRQALAPQRKLIGR